MPEISRRLSVEQGFDFNKDVQAPLGFITAMKIGTKALHANLNCKKATNPKQGLKAVAVLTHVHWNYNLTGPIYFDGRIGVLNRIEVADLVADGLANIQCEFKFVVFDYDPLKGKYFETFHSNNKAMKAVIELNREDLNIAVGVEPEPEPQSPDNYHFQIGLVPQPQAQSLHLATSHGKNKARAWGLKVT